MRRIDNRLDRIDALVYRDGVTHTVMDNSDVFTPEGGGGGMAYGLYSIPPQQGWQCPVCGRVYAPWMSECSHCGNSVVTTSSGTRADNNEEGK